MIEKPYRVYAIEVKNAQVKQFESYLVKLQLFACAGRKIPPHIVRKMIECISLPGTIDEEIEDERSKEIAGRAFDYFSTKADYVLRGAREVSMIDAASRQPGQIIGFKKVMIDISVKEVCLFALKSFQDTSPKLINKGATIRFLYKKLYQYIDQYSPELAGKLTHYRATVVATYLANELGLVQPAIGKISNPVLYAKGKDDTKSLHG